jgi:hypothetical protein
MTTTTIQKILSINSKYEWQGYEFIMSNPSKNIICKISNIANCCENFGIHTNCNLSDFIGAEYKTVSISTNPADEDGYDYMHIVHVTIQTDRGEILIQLYNEHNGYYPHDFFTQSEHGTKIESL